VLQTDGQIRTGRDLAMATLLGAEEWGIATASLVVSGCIMMRKCHLNTCPVGVATQDESLRKLFTGNPDHVVNFFRFLANDLREHMAELGFRTINEMVGRTDVLRVRQPLNHWKLEKLDLSPILHREPMSDHVGVYKQIEQDFELEKVLDRKLIKAAKAALENAEPVSAEFEIRNIDRTTGAMLSNEISKVYKGVGLPEDTIQFMFKGSAGQSFGAFAAPGVTFRLEGEGNDYFGKGLSGGKLIIYPSREAGFKPEENIIIGNVAFYGATSGEAYIRGMAGERFCVRNSGVKAVVEGVGDHACEYMTGGRVVVLGNTGKNFAAGMSGGVAYVYNGVANDFARLCNNEMVDLEPMSDEDKEEVRRLISRHSEYTGSEPAQKILADWEHTSELFVKVMPRDYKAVLEKQKAKKAAKAEPAVVK
jgi:glutamate synthase (NADPH/NADH) large chain